MCVCLLHVQCSYSLYCLMPLTFVMLPRGNQALEELESVLPMPFANVSAFSD